MLLVSPACRRRLPVVLVFWGGAPLRPPRSPPFSALCLNTLFFLEVAGGRFDYSVKTPFWGAEERYLSEPVSPETRTLRRAHVWDLKLGMGPYEAPSLVR